MPQRKWSLKEDSLQHRVAAEGDLDEVRRCAHWT